VDEEEMVGRLNRRLRGWVNYFDLGSVSRAYNAVNYHVTSRLRRWLCRKHKVRGPGYSRYSDRYLYHELGLYQLRRRRQSVPSAPG
jgi:RNA-directed DNA polymerase